MPKIKEQIQMAPMNFRKVPESLVDDIINNYPKKRAKHLLDQQTKWPKENFSPFDLGFACNAYHFFSLTQWESRPDPDPGLLEIFHEGNLHEPDIVKKLESAGYEVSDINVPLSIKWGRSKSVRGKIDFFLRKDGVKIPCEAKSMTPFAFNKINVWEDFLTSKSSFHRCYPYQLAIYLHACNKADFGLFILKDKSTGDIKLIKMPYSETLVEEAKKRVIFVSRVIAKNEGDLEQMKIKDPLWCNRCDFKFQCLGNDGENMVPLIEDEELEEVLLRRETLKEFQSEYKKLDSIVKSTFKGKEEILIGDFFIKGKEVKRKGFTVADGEYWKTDVIYKGNAIDRRKALIDDE